MKRLVRASRRPRWRGLAVVMGMAVMVVGWGGASAAGERVVSVSARADLVSVGPAVGTPIPWGFVGVSLEYGTVGTAERTGPQGADPVLARLIRGLAPGQTPVVRIGGDSTDWMWWPARGIRKPPGARGHLTPAWMARARALARTTRPRLILGLNLEDDNPALAATEARHLLAGIGRRYVEALEVGNEPELYSGLPWYHTSSGAKVFGRPLGYNITDYSREFSRFAQQLPPVPLAGPSTGSQKWIAQLGPLLAAQPRLRLVTFHAYALDPAGAAFRGHDCSTPIGEPSHPTVRGLLSSSAAFALIQRVSPFVALAHSRHLHFRVDEMNAITCAGQPGVSNTSASALWVIDALFALWRAGVDGVNVHTWRGSDGKLFDMHFRHGQWSGSVFPEYYGLLTFARAVPPGSRLLQTSQSGDEQLRAWALQAPDHSTRVVLINDSLSGTRSVDVQVPGARRRAKLERLRAPSAYARSGVTLAGQSFGSKTTSGLLDGSPRVETVRSSGGAYSVRLPAASAAVLTIG